MAHSRCKIHLCEPDLTPVPDTSDCPSNDSHTPAPVGYLAWHDWAAMVSRTHRQRRCPDCGLWKIWESKTVFGDV